LSALLFHGPGAMEEAIDAVGKYGLLMGDPVGEEGLKTEHVREIVAKLQAPSPGSKRGVMVIGPVDNIPAKAADALLKTLEEVTPNRPLPILWANDAGVVIPTIRSRCLMTWCPAGADPDLPFFDTAAALCRAALQRNWGTVVDLITSNKGDEEALLMATASVLSQSEGDARQWLPMWLSIREALKSTHRSKTEVVSAFLWEQTNG